MAAPRIANTRKRWGLALSPADNRRRTPPRAPPTTPASAIPLPAEEVFEVPAEDMDLAELAELAKKVVERKP